MFRHVRAAGLMERRDGYYAVKIAGTVVAFAAGWAALAVLGDSWASLGAAAFMGLVFTQAAFIGHDAGHHQILSTRRWNNVLGLVVGNVATGLSFGWWVPKHGAHHAHPNSEDRDPDIAPGVIAFTAANARGRRGLAGWACRHQAGLFFLLLPLEAVSLHVASIQSLWQRRASRSARWEALLLGIHIALYLAGVFWLLSPGRAVAFVVVQQGVFGFYLGCSFAPNHKGMPLLEPGSQLGFAERQVLTARNVTAGRFVTFLLGGLDYQIEHHLFPTMPRPNLAKAQPYAKEFCAANSIPYHETGLVDSYRQALRHLHNVGTGARPDWV